MLSSKYLIGIFMTSLWISYYFLFATISSVHSSLWIDIIMIFIYLESYTLERNYISRRYPFFHDHLVFLVSFLWWLRESLCLECGSYIVASWCTLLWWRSFFFSCLSWRGFCHLYWFPSSWQSYPFYIFTTGCHKHRLFIWLVVSLWTHLLLCVRMIGLALCISFIPEYIDA